MARIKSAYDNGLQNRQDLELKFAQVEEEAGRQVREAEERANSFARDVEEKAMAAMASETTRIQIEFNNRLGRAVEEAVLAYRRDRGRAVEQATAFIDGDVYILSKIKEAFPEEDWSRFPVPEVTEGLVDDEHKAIFQEIEEELDGASNKQQQQ